MLKQPETKYRPFAPVPLADRQWPNRTLTAPPIWMSTDLRDGNQALFEPMNTERKMRMFRTLCEIGFREIEVSREAMTFVSTDEEAWWRQMLNLGWASLIKKIENAGTEELQRVKAAIFYDLRPFKHPDGIHFDKTVFFVSGVK